MTLVNKKTAEAHFEQLLAKALAPCAAPVTTTYQAGPSIVAAAHSFTVVLQPGTYFDLPRCPAPEGGHPSLYFGFGDSLLPASTDPLGVCNPGIQHSGNDFVRLAMPAEVTLVSRRESIDSLVNPLR